MVSELLLQCLHGLLASWKLKVQRLLKGLEAGLLVAVPGSPTWSRLLFSLSENLYILGSSFLSGSKMPGCWRAPDSLLTSLNTKARLVQEVPMLMAVSLGCNAAPGPNFARSWNWKCLAMRAWQEHRACVGLCKRCLPDVDSSPGVFIPPNVKQSCTDRKLT